MTVLRDGEGKAPRVIIAGGWTGGHLFCALAIAEALRRRHSDAQVLLVGARGGMEVELARTPGFPLETVWVDAFARGLTLEALARNLVLPLKLAVGGLQALGILRTFQPDVVVGVGAYVSVPVVAVAQALGVPTLLHEANAQPGLANRLLARYANVICVGVPEVTRTFERAVGRRADRRIVLTGNPVRPAVTASAGLSTREARLRLGLEASTRTVLVMGGSLGSARLNEWALGHGPAIVASGGQILWQCGRSHFAACRSRLVDGEGVHLVAFLDDMAAAYAAADLIVAGAGASTVAEVACLGKAAIFVPDPTVTEGHQGRNAEDLRLAGAAVYDSRELGPDLAQWVRALLHDAERLRTLGSCLARLGRPDAAASVVAEVMSLCAR